MLLLLDDNMAVGCCVGLDDLLILLFILSHCSLMFLLVFLFLLLLFLVSFCFFVFCFFWLLYFVVLLPVLLLLLLLFRGPSCPSTSPS